MGYDVGGPALDMLDYIAGTQQTFVIPALIEAVHQLILKDYGLLPENLYFFIANEVAAFQEQEGLWLLKDEDVLLLCDHKDMQFVDPTRQLVKLPGFPHAWGLPHVIRNVSLEAISIMHQVVRTLPGALCSMPAPDTVREADGVLQITSLQGPSLLHSPSMLALQLPPYLQLRVDVQVKGTRLDDAIDTFIQGVLDDIGYLDQQNHVIHGVLLVGNESERFWKSGRYGAVPSNCNQQAWTMDELEDESIHHTFIHTLKRAVIAKQRAVIDVSLAAEVQTTTTAESKQKTTSFLETQIEYVFHFADKQNRVHSHACIPMESLFCGVFLDQFSAQQYQLLFSEINNPYAYGVVEQNICRMHRCMGQAYRSGDIVTAFGYLLMAAQLDGISKVCPRHPLSAAALPTIHRALHSHPAKLSGLARQLKLLWKIIILEQTHLVKTKLLVDFIAEDTETKNDYDELLHALKVKEQARQQQISSHFQDLQKRAGEILSNVDFMECKAVQIRFRHILDQVPEKICPGGMNQKTVDLLRSAHNIVLGVSQSMATGMCKRCWVLSILLKDLGEDPAQMNFSHNQPFDDEAGSEAPRLFVYEPASQVHLIARTAPPSFFSEAAHLQYAVDAILDKALKEVYIEIATSPMPSNPFATLSDRVMQRGFLLHGSPYKDDHMLLQLHNSIALAVSPGFIYCGCAPGVRNDVMTVEGEFVVYGLPSAVAFADVRTAFLWSKNFGELTTRRRWQHGAYQSEVIVALTGDVVFGNLVSCVPLRNPNLLPTNGDVPNSANHSGVNHAHHRVSQPSFSKEGWSRGSEDFQSIMTLKQTDSNRVPTANTITGDGMSIFWHTKLRLIAELVEVHLVNGPNIIEAAHSFAKEVVLRLSYLHNQRQYHVLELLVSRHGSKSRWSMVDINRCCVEIIQEIVGCVKELNDDGITAAISFSHDGDSMPVLLHFRFGFYESFARPFLSMPWHTSLIPDCFF
mmetsp:Transcript_36322/g.69679  ORF Transcript_36322/g.69679 Transcript_36322/m.69679 type:complete len:972 (+) Transcript_36322:160-3075(+)